MTRFVSAVEPPESLVRTGTRSAFGLRGSFMPADFAPRNSLLMVSVALAAFFCLSCSPMILEYDGTGAEIQPDFSTLPRSIRPAVSGESADRRLSLSVITGAGAETGDVPPGTVRRDFLVPVVPWLSSENQSLRLVPLKNTALPDRIIHAGGLRPGDAGYPHVNWTVLRLERVIPGMEKPSGRRTDRLNARLEKWLVDETHRLLEDSGTMDSPQQFFTLAAVGDIMPGRGFGDLLLAPGGVEDALGDVAPLLRVPDLLIGNLETAVTSRSTAVPKSYNFKVSPEVLKAVVDLGFDFLHLANNHGWDYGEAGFLDTLEAVVAAGVGFSGAGENLEASRFAWETTMPDGRKLQVLSLGAYFTERNGFDGASAASSAPGKPGVLWDSDENEDFIRTVLGRGDSFSVVTVHGGYEWEDVPREDVKQRYRRYVDWGADLVLAHHPHVLQGVELYKGAPIAYSLGNFIFPGMSGWYTGEETGILEFLIHENRVVGMEFVPVMIDDVRLRRAKNSSITERFLTMSRDLNAVQNP